MTSLHLRLLGFCVFSCTVGCGLLGRDFESPYKPNRVVLDVDGVEATVIEPSIAFINDEKLVYGLFPMLQISVKIDAGESDPFVHHTLRISVPLQLGEGEHTLYPSLHGRRDKVWLQFRDVDNVRSTGASGTMTITKMPEVGGHFKAHFTKIDTINSCGVRHQLTNGELDIFVGDETAYPAVYEEIFDEDDDHGLYAAAGETVSWMTLDGETMYMPGTIADLWTIPANETGTGQAVDAIDIGGTALCDSDLDDGLVDWAFGFAGDFPISTEPVVTLTQPVYWLAIAKYPENVPPEVHANGSNLEFYYYNAPLPVMDYFQLEQQQDGVIDIRLARPMQFFKALPERDLTDTIELQDLVITGRIARDCRPGACPDI